MSRVVMDRDFLESQRDVLEEVVKGVFLVD